jgi:hypothetical protein
MSTQAEREYLRAKARVKLERQIAREAERERWAAAHPHGGKVAAALLVFGLLLMFIGVQIVMQNNPWKTSSAPLQPIPSTTTTVPPRGGPGECGSPHSDECAPITTTPFPSTNAPGRTVPPNGEQLPQACPDDPTKWCLGLTTLTNQPGVPPTPTYPSWTPTTTLPPAPQGVDPDVRKRNIGLVCANLAESPTSQQVTVIIEAMRRAGIPPEQAADIIHAAVTSVCPQFKDLVNNALRNLSASPTTTMPTIPGVPGSRQGQTI